MLYADLTMPDGRFSLRRARPDELRAIVGIDDAASALYAEAGLELALAPEHPFVLAETARWARAIENSLAHVAVDSEDRILGFMTLGIVDQAPYLDQLAVQPHAMRRGIGAALIGEAVRWSAARPLWLTTYSHFPWNQPYYARHGFIAVPESECGPELRAILEDQRVTLPAPEKRVAMVHGDVENSGPR